MISFTGVSPNSTTNYYLDNKDSFLNQWKFFPYKAASSFEQQAFQNLMAMKEDIYLEMKLECATKNKSSRSLQSIFSSIQKKCTPLGVEELDFMRFIKLTCSLKHNGFSPKELLKNKLMTKVFKKATGIARPFVNGPNGPNSPNDSLDCHLEEIVDLIKKEEGKLPTQRSLVSVFRQLQANHQLPSSAYFNLVDFLKKQLFKTNLSTQRGNLAALLNTNQLSSLLLKAFNAQLALIYLEKLSFFKETVDQPYTIQLSDLSALCDPHMTKLNSIIELSSLI